MALALSTTVAALAGVVLGIPVLRLRGDYLAIVTLGFGEIVYLVLLNLDRPINITGGVAGILEVDHPDLFLFTADSLVANYYLILVFLLLSVFAAHRLVASRIGRAWVAIREDETAAAAVGINTTSAKLWAFGIGASFSGFAGSLFAALQGAVFPNTFLFTQSILVLAMVIIGGMGTLWGPLIGAAVMIVLPEVLRDVGALRFVIVGVVFVVLMIFRPFGILGAGGPSVACGGRSDDARPELGPARESRTGRRDRVAGDRRPDAPVRWSRRRRRSRAEDRGRLDLGDHRPERRRQDDGVQRHHGLPCPHRAAACATPVATSPDSLPTASSEQGIARTFQNIRLFPLMTALENVVTGAHARLKQPSASGPSSACPRPGARSSRRSAPAWRCSNGSASRRRRTPWPGELPYGSQRRLEIARALASKPRLLLLDEPAAGANPYESAVLARLIRDIRDSGVTVVLIEHDMSVVMRLSDGITVLDHGRKLAEGTPETIRDDEPSDRGVPRARQRGGDPQPGRSACQLGRAAPSSSRGSRSPTAPSRR